MNIKLNKCCDEMDIVFSSRSGFEMIGWCNKCESKKVGVDRLGLNNTLNLKRFAEAWNAQVPVEEPYFRTLRPALLEDNVLYGNEVVEYKERYKPDLRSVELPQPDLRSVKGNSCSANCASEVASDEVPLMTGLCPNKLKEAEDD